MFCCLRGCLTGLRLTPAPPPRPPDNPIQLDTSHMGHEVVIVKGGQRVCGSGCALGNAPLVQSKSYFEVKLQQGGVWAIGLATRNTDLDRVHGGMDKESWCLNSDGTVRHNNLELYRLTSDRPKSPADLVTTDLLGTSPPSPSNHTVTSQVADPRTMPCEGDTIGIAFDHIELNFFLNGRNMEVPIPNIKGAVYPALYVDDGAILDLILENFHYPPPSGFERIMLEQSLL
ncbi:SPRY domain-containing protein 7 [Arctopsyche grandis]|uniref:SPRY domain-containing protein 7 n=1 Tax=Arctopsyche grandis TaxID=121162 RepID=UPI00406D9AD4